MVQFDEKTIAEEKKIDKTRTDNLHIMYCIPTQGAIAWCNGKRLELTSAQA